ncbi:hypothetical protein AVEN_41908-1 [Araneus ventricosus]|uniref:Uncharacterized protein n=1 Tax=Araneus ventricosus TaxID=182803 RepID=A0A4Y2ACB9_ARAVE|nr:hypothetical protein AVEN_41908-1 [Araneus ventricosus]
MLPEATGIADCSAKTLPLSPSFLPLMSVPKYVSRDSVWNFLSTFFRQWSTYKMNYKDVICPSEAILGVIRRGEGKWEVRSSRRIANRDLRLDDRIG